MYSRNEKADFITRRFSGLYKEFKNTYLIDKYKNLLTQLSNCVININEYVWMSNPNAIKKYHEILEEISALINKSDLHTYKCENCKTAIDKELAHLPSDISKALELQKQRNAAERKIEIDNARIQGIAIKKAEVLKNEQAIFIKKYEVLFEQFPEFSFANKYLEDYKYAKELYENCKIKFSPAMRELTKRAIHILFLDIHEEKFIGRDHIVYKKLKTR